MDGPSSDVRQVGCLDMAVESRVDSEAEGPVVRFVFGNRCDAPVVVDLAAVRATVRYRDGYEGRMQVFDPRGVIKPGLLEAHTRGTEVLEYTPLDPGDQAAGARELCLDLTHVDRDQRSPEPVITCLQIGAAYRVAEGSP